VARAREQPKTEKEATLQAKTVDELREIARRNEIEGYSNLQKDELVALLESRRLAAEPEPQPEKTADELLEEELERERFREGLRRRFGTG
jgi:hypothetical protein